MAKVKEVDKGWNKIKRELIGVERLVVDAGVQNGEKENNGFDMAWLAFMLEYGYSGKRKVTHYKRLSVGGTRFLRKGRFVKKKDANYAESFIANIDMPARPFMRDSFDESKNELSELSNLAIKRVLWGRLSLVQSLQVVGQKLERIIKRKIVVGPWEPNAPSTIKQKGSNRPLIDTGRLRQSIRYVVRHR